MKLYKYMPGKRASDFFDLPLLRLANPNGLNDPFEFSLTRELSEGIESMHKEEGTREKGLRNHIKNFLSFGIISISETYDNLLMWSHYADEHRGAVFEFEIEESNPNSLFLYGTPTPSPDAESFGKVDYRKFRRYQYAISPSTIPDIRRHYIFIKSDEWMYEKEQRFVMHYSHADIVRVNKKECETAFKVNELNYTDFERGGGVEVRGDDLWIYLHDSKITPRMLEQMWIMTAHMKSFFFKIIDFERVTKVIIGCRHSDAIEKAIKNTRNPRAVGRFYHEGEFINVLKARPSEERFELDFEDYRGDFLSMLR